MKSTGIVRNIDNLGRISIPKAILKVLAIKIGDPLEVLTDQENGDTVIILRKNVQGCVFCDTLENTIEYKGKKICKGCIQGI